MFDGWAPISGAIVSPEVILIDLVDFRLSKIPIIFVLLQRSMARRFRIPIRRI
jgi:hypothetical protein